VAEVPDARTFSDFCAFIDNCCWMGLVGHEEC
jgi:hypothetical protein